MQMIKSYVKHTGNQINTYSEIKHKNINVN